MLSTYTTGRYSCLHGQSISLRREVVTLKPAVTGGHLLQIVVFTFVANYRLTLLAINITQQHVASIANHNIVVTRIRRPVAGNLPVRLTETDRRVTFKAPFVFADWCRVIKNRPRNKTRRRRNWPAAAAAAGAGSAAVLDGVLRSEPPGHPGARCAQLAADGRAIVIRRRRRRRRYGASRRLAVYTAVGHHGRSPSVRLSSISFN